jgi:hypothetical protein
MRSFTDDENEISSWWRLSDELSVIEAILLVLGYEPQGLAEYVDNHDARSQPAGYVAVKSGILAGLRSKALLGVLYCVEYEDDRGNWREDPSRLDLSRSKVNVASLINWLSSRGVSTGYFFSEDRARRGLNDRKHPRYAPKLAAAVEAWESFDVTDSGPGTAKQKLMKWLRLHAAEYGLVDDEGKPREGVIEELAGIANWAPKGGAPKATAPDPPAEPEDDEIPF